MDLTSTSFLFSLLLLLVSLLLLKKHRSGGGAPPILGSLHHLLGGLPHRSLTALSKKFGPVILLKLGEVPTLVVSSAEAAAEIMKTHDISFASRPTNLNLQSATYGDRGELRKMSIVELLSAKRVQSFRFIREEEVLNLVRSIVQLSNAGSRSVIGSKCKYQKDFIRIVMQTLEAAGGFSLADLFPSWPIIKLLTSFRSTEKKPAEQQEEEEDLVDVMLRVQAEGSLSFPLADEDMKAMMLRDLRRNNGVGHVGADEESKSDAAVAKEAKVTESEINGMNYLRLVIKENLRLHPPVPLLLPRECRETCEVLGYRIPEKTRVFVNVWALGRDPRHWDNATEFEPERFERRNSMVDFKGTNFEFLPFGAGRRICPGMSFGMPQELDMSETFSITCRRKSDLCLRAIPHALMPRLV
ncbi:cytochrome P450 [Musa troglodytarum]|uniref:Cytochrome P450 n=1 Tax=Musa troglodytarum TaxID=320322 RepID=A0A9E7GCS0_9LILI|nr:cytochrome P450 [Musa troglodytarum]